MNIQDYKSDSNSNLPVDMQWIDELDRVGELDEVEARAEMCDNTNHSFEGEYCNNCGKHK